MQNLVLWFTAACDRATIRKDAKKHCVSVHGSSAAGLWFPSEEGGTLCGDCFHQRVRLYTNPGMDLSIHKYPIRMETCVHSELLI